MRAQQDSLKKKIKETTDMYEDEHERHLKSMAALKRDSEAQLKRVRELEVFKIYYVPTQAFLFWVVWLHSEVGNIVQRVS